ncbi:MAG TPA: ferritin family protein [Rhodocyclaceae bacterium]|nr:ferritin family protein [Rhodocyclaceae bacterium]HMV53174.1 ferritin family protein [Rhodocyclaceae bacterium]HMZ84254.1 ferritin family protein [Rhodocyclaceae bacterium]HNA05001.1 ferritin family protein [Rhodocyclaceae bacterium]HNB79363.1 ferritin family protein [Rhodocyclaceae bacterium]
MESARRINSIAQCYAHALAVDHEAVSRYAQFAEWLEARGSDATARLFREMARFTEEHAKSLESRIGDAALPRVKETEHDWIDNAPHDQADDSVVLQLMTAFDALKIAEDAELHAQHFFEQIAASAENTEVRKFARELSRELAAHVRQLDTQLARTPHPPAPDTMVPSGMLG